MSEQAQNCSDVVEFLDLSYNFVRPFYLNKLSFGWTNAKNGQKLSDTWLQFQALVYQVFLNLSFIYEVISQPNVQKSCNYVHARAKQSGSA